MGTAKAGISRRLVLRYGIVGLLAAGLLSGCSGTGELEAQNQDLKSQVESLSAVKESLSYSNLKFEITNNTDKDIQGIQGKLKIMDLFGKEILTAGCDFTGHTIPAGETVVNDDLSFEINEFINEHMKLYTTAYEDLKSEYTVTQIVFTDGTVKE